MCVNRSCPVLQWMFEYIWTPEVEAEVERALQLSLKTKILHVSNDLLLLKTNASSASDTCLFTLSFNSTIIICLLNICL